MANRAISVRPNEDLTGRRYGKRIVIGPGGKRGPHRLWILECECGRKHLVQTGSLKHSNSCRYCCQMENGILQPPARKARTSWWSARARCRNPNNKNYANYGGRGIKVCDWWDTFARFYKDMGDPPSPKHTLDRIDVQGHYEPGNCRWATPQEQADNRRKFGALDKFTDEELLVELRRRGIMVDVPAGNTVS